MKKLMYIAAALLVLVGCKKDNALNNTPEGTPFKKGQQVTLTVGAGAQQGPNRVAGVENTTDDQIDFKWEVGDQILVKVGQESAVFTLSSEPGLEYGEFAGVMPAGGSTFDIQYPINEPNITKQVYTEEKPIPADSMLFKATNCTLDADAFLLAQHAMVQFNLFGTDKTIGKIVFTNKTDNPAKSYTLICTGGKTIGTTSAEATPFYMVVPTGTYQFEAEIWDNATTPAMICSFATSAAQTFTAGKCLNMPAKEVKEPFVPTDVDLGLPSGVKWATCNVGATKPEEYGDYFAWGETEPYYSSQIPLTWKTGKETGYSWASYFDSNDGETFTKYYNGGGKTTLDLADDAAAANWKGNWRMPTKAEFEELVNTENCEWKWCDGETEKYNNTTVKGYLVTSKTNSNSIFLPVSGYRSNSVLYAVGDRGYYWSSSLYEYSGSSSAYILFFKSDKIDEGGMRDHRSEGLSVRPVCK